MQRCQLLLTFACLSQFTHGNYNFSSLAMSSENKTILPRLGTACRQKASSVRDVLCDILFEGVVLSSVENCLYFFGSSSISAVFLIGSNTVGKLKV